MNLADWAESVFAVVEQDGAHATRIQVMTPASGDVWHTWTAPFPKPDEWATRAESVLRTLEQQSSGRTSVIFVALGQDGETLHQLPWRVVGKLQGGNLESVQQATAATFASLTQTLERVNELAQSQLSSARAQLEVNNEFIGQQQQLIMAYRREALTVEAHESPLAAMLETYGPQIGNALSMIMTVAAHHFAEKSNKPVKRAPEPEAEVREPIDGPPIEPKPKGARKARRPTTDTIKR